MAERVYAVSCGEAQHIIPADSHEETEEGDLVVQGKENHTYGPQDWDFYCWANTRPQLLDMLSRIRMAPRLQD